jgi:hypothetical protein
MSRPIPPSHDAQFDDELQAVYDEALRIMMTNAPGVAARLGLPRQSAAAHDDPPPKLDGPLRAAYDAVLALLRVVLSFVDCLDQRRRLRSPRLVYLGARVYREILRYVALRDLTILGRGQEEAEAKVNAVLDDLIEARDRAGLPRGRGRPFQQTCAHLAALHAGRELISQAKTALMRVPEVRRQYTTPDGWKEWSRPTLDIGLADQHFAALEQRFDTRRFRQLEALAGEIRREAVLAQAGRRGVARRPARRCRFKVRRSRAYLDGNRIDKDLTPEAREQVVFLLENLIEAEGAYVSGGDMDRKRGDRERRRWDRILSVLPPEARGLIDTDRRKGMRLGSCAWRK